MIENPLLLSLIQTVEIFYPFNNSSKSTISWCEGWRSWGVVTSVSTECSLSVPEVWCFFLTWALSLSLLENVELHWEQLWTTPEWVVWCRERCFLFLKHFSHWEHENSATFFSSSSSSSQSPRGSSFSSRVFFSWFSTLFSTWYFGFGTDLEWVLLCLADFLDGMDKGLRGKFDFFLWPIWQFFKLIFITSAVIWRSNSSSLEQEMAMPLPRTLRRFEMELEEKGRDIPTCSTPLDIGSNSQGQ